jgi:predicted transcriptional regulator
MSQTWPTEAITIRIAKARQVQRIEEGLAAMREGRVSPADEVFARIAAKYGWARENPPT